MFSDEAVWASSFGGSEKLLVKSVEDAVESCDAAADVINGFDLPCYRSQLKKNLQKQFGGSASDAGSGSASEQDELAPLLHDRVFLCRVLVPKLKKAVSVSKQIQVTLSDEGFRLTFPPPFGVDKIQSRNKIPYKPLQLWFPRQFCSASARVRYHLEQGWLCIVVPVKADNALAEMLDEDLLEEIF